MKNTVLSLLGLIIASSSAVCQVQIHDVHFYMRELDTKAGLEFTKRLTADQFREQLAGDLRLGAFIVRAIIKCSGDSTIDTTRIRLRIKNDATGKIVYNTHKLISNEAILDSVVSGISLCDSLGNWIPSTAREHAIAPGEYVSVVFPPFEPSEFLDFHVGRLRLAIIAHRSGDSAVYFTQQIVRLDRNWGFSRFAVEASHMQSSNAVIPSTLLFVNGGTTFTSQDSGRSFLYREHRILHPYNTDTISITNPAIRFDRRSERGAPYQGLFTGDTLTSAALNLTRVQTATLSISARRVYPRDLTHRRWMLDTLFGPEPTTSAESTTYPGDQIVIDILRPSPDQLNGIVNTVDSHWIQQPAMRAALRMRDPNYRDRYEVFTIPIPDSILKSKNEGARNVRFRLVLHATSLTERDDDDPWEVEGISINTDEQLDLSINDVVVPLPYSVISYRQASLAPLRVNLVNHTQNTHRRIRLRVVAYSAQDTTRRTTIERFIDSFGALEQREIEMPPFNLSTVAVADLDTIILRASIAQGNDTTYKDNNQHNNTIYRRMPVRLGRSLAYDNYEEEGHHVVANEAGLSSNFGLRTPATKTKDDSVSRYGGTDQPTQVGPGGITMTFALAQRDTLFGYQFAFDRDLPRQSACSISLVRIQKEDALAIPDASLEIYPGRADNGTVTDTIGTYSLSAPVALDSGTYEVTITQHAHDDLNLCATTARAGVLVRVANSEDPMWGSEIIADPTWFVDPTRPTFPFRNENFSTRGRFFVGERGYRSFTYGDYGGSVNGALTFRRGTFIPVMRVVLGHRTDSLPSSVAEQGGIPPTTLVTLSPSPASTSLTISTEVSGGATVRFYTMQGEHLFTKDVQSTLTINTASLSSGQYIVIAQSGPHSQTQTVIVVR